MIEVKTFLVLLCVGTAYSMVVKDDKRIADPNQHGCATKCNEYTPGLQCFVRPTLCPNNGCAHGSVCCDNGCGPTCVGEQSSCGLCPELSIWVICPRMYHRDCPLTGCSGGKTCCAGNCGGSTCQNPVF